ncbi:SH3 domain-containing protein [Pseudoduganella sp. GCM10020061]|uniref:SH3 domain-containing protein n=1 Tax=Pseudoduganella sp. GCM10020061 TaxID=3317345 RepID=UPI00363A47EC
MLTLHYSTVLAWIAAFVLTVLLARFLTPQRWWRNANARAGAVLVIGTWAIGTLLVPLAARAFPPEPGPRAGERYVVYRDLNLRSGTGTGALRLATVTAGESVTATGLREGDWWQVRTEKQRTGWASSLWLRRPQEVGY